MNEQQILDREELSKKVMKRLEDAIGEPVTERDRRFDAILEAGEGDGDAVILAAAYIMAGCKLDNPLLEIMGQLKFAYAYEKEMLCSARMNIGRSRSSWNILVWGSRVRAVTRQSMVRTSSPA